MSKKQKLDERSVRSFERMAAALERIAAVCNNVSCPRAAKVTS